MSITKKELEQKVQAIRSLKALKEETENELKALESEIVSYMKDNELSEEFTETSKITYLPQSRKSLDKDKLQEVIENLADFEKVTTYSVLRIK
ncbi:MAG: hypothetical protein IKW30_03085 [Lachnospiraceae bacterium]|nr:hypothetical protein [Lachnospiraceae bacterium]